MYSMLMEPTALCWMALITSDSHSWFPCDWELTFNVRTDPYRMLIINTVIRENVYPYINAIITCMLDCRIHPSSLNGSMDTLNRVWVVGVSGFVRVALAFAVFVGTALARIVFAFIPAKIMSFLDWERSQKFFPSTYVCYCCCCCCCESMNVSLHVSMSARHWCFILDIRLFRGFHDNPESKTIDMSSMEVSMVWYGMV